MRRILIFAIGILFSTLVAIKTPCQDEEPGRQFRQASPDDIRWTMTTSDGQGRWDSWSLIRESRVLKKGLLAPSLDDRLAFDSFLRQPNTGLIRLLPREIYGRGTFKNFRTKKQFNIPGGGAYYYFDGLRHAYGYGSDIELDQNMVSVGFAGTDYGMMTNLGEQPLQDINLTNSCVQFLLNYRAAKLETAARSEFRRFQKGDKIDGFFYKSRFPAEVNATYLLRSIVYGRSDVLVAFRIIRQDTEGSVTIAWKLLKKYPVPELVSNK